MDGLGLYGFFYELSNKTVLIQVGVVLLLHLKLSLEVAVKLCAKFMQVHRHHSPHFKLFNDIKCSGCFFAFEIFCDAGKLHICAFVRTKIAKALNIEEKLSV